MAGRGSLDAPGTRSTCGRMHTGRSGPTGLCTAFTSACCGILSVYAKKKPQHDAAASVAGNELFEIDPKLALTRHGGLPYLPHPRRGHECSPEASRRGSLRIRLGLRRVGDLRV